MKVDVSEKKTDSEQTDPEAPVVDAVSVEKTLVPEVGNAADATVVPTADAGSSESSEDDTSSTAVRGPRNRKKISLIAAAVLALVLFALAAFQYWGPGAANRDVDQNQSTAATFAGDSAIKILSYKHGTVDQDVEAATKLLTGDFLDYYQNFTSTVVIPAAKKESVDTQATIAGTSVERASADGATVLVFVNQSTTTAANDTPTLSASSVRVVLKRVNGQLKVEKFDPV